MTDPDLTPRSVAATGEVSGAAVRGGSVTTTTKATTVDVDATGKATLHDLTATGSTTLGATVAGPLDVGSAAAPACATVHGNLAVSGTSALADATVTQSVVALDATVGLMAGRTVWSTRKPTTSPRPTGSSSLRSGTTKARTRRTGCGASATSSTSSPPEARS